MRIAFSNVNQIMIRLALDCVCERDLHLLVLAYKCLSRNKCVEVHEVFCQGASFIKAEHVNHTSDDGLVRRSAENLFLFHLFKREDDSEGHANRQARRNSHCNQIKELNK